MINIFPSRLLSVFEKLEESGLVEILEVHPTAFVVRSKNEKAGKMA